MSASRTLDLTEKLLGRESVTPDDKGCQDHLKSWLEPLGFRCETIVSGEVTNLWARKGTESPVLVFAGHTDVVPTGPLEKWSSEPFYPTHRDGKLYGRGAADMKTSIAAMTEEREIFPRRFEMGLPYCVPGRENPRRLTSRSRISDWLSLNPMADYFA